jgi:hypothetical protein
MYPTLRHQIGTLAALCLAVAGLSTMAAPATAMPERVSAPCINPAGHDSADGARGGKAGDTRDISAKEQKAINARTLAILKADGTSPSSAALAAAAVPVYFHVMLSTNGAGDVTQTQINNQVTELNQDYAGGESSSAANTGFTFTLAGVNRYYNNNWHRDKQSTTYRTNTRQGGKNALNIWLVDFAYLGIATFPWDYAAHPGIDGIRVQYSSLPGGSVANYNLGKTATHEAGHWFGLYHTFQGGCTSTNDGVSDTPAQSSSTAGCPAGRDSCSLPGLDPIHNYMDYSYDSCYDQFIPGQSSRMSQMWTAYRA